jgi:hypothetical protein
MRLSIARVSSTLTITLAALSTLTASSAFAHQG